MFEVSIKTHTGWNLYSKSDFPRTNKSCLIGHLDTFLEHCADAKEYFVCWCMVGQQALGWFAYGDSEKGHEQQGRESKERAAVKLSNLCSEKNKKKGYSIKNSWARVQQSLTILRIQWIQVYGTSNLSQGLWHSFPQPSHSGLISCQRSLTLIKISDSGVGAIFSSALKSFLDGTQYKESRVCSPDWRPKC